MAKSGIPGALERRHLIERDLPPAQALAIADAYLEAGRLEESVQFLLKAEAGERLDALAEEAVESGNMFLLRSIANARGVEPPTETWGRLAAAARAAGKELYAESADRLAHRNDD